MTAIVLNSVNLLRCADAARRPKVLMVRHVGAELTLTAPPGETARLTRAVAAELRVAVERFLGRHGVKRALDAPTPPSVLWGVGVWRLRCRDGLERADRGFAITVEDESVLFTSPAGGTARLDAGQAGPLWMVLGVVLDGQIGPSGAAVADNGSVLPCAGAVDQMGRGSAHA